MAQVHKRQGQPKAFLSCRSPEDRGTAYEFGRGPLLSESQGATVSSRGGVLFYPTGSVKGMRKVPRALSVGIYAYAGEPAPCIC